jgi:hypothetical protein
VSKCGSVCTRESARVRLDTGRPDRDVVWDVFAAVHEVEARHSLITRKIWSIPRSVASCTTLVRLIANWFFRSFVRPTLMSQVILGMLIFLFAYFQ